jgi:hypothetical protein
MPIGEVLKLHESLSQANNAFVSLHTVMIRAYKHLKHKSTLIFDIFEFYQRFNSAIWPFRRKNNCNSYCQCLDIAEFLEM